MNAQEWESAMARIHAATETRTQTKLAELLGIRQSSVADAKRRHSIPNDWLVTLAVQQGLHPVWVLTGKGGKYAVPSDQPDTVLLAERLRELEDNLRASVVRDFAASISLDDAKAILAAKLPRGAVVQVSYHDTITGTGGATGLAQEEVWVLTGQGREEGKASIVNVIPESLPSAADIVRVMRDSKTHGAMSCDTSPAFPIANEGI